MEYYGHGSTYLNNCVLIQTAVLYFLRNHLYLGYFRILFVDALQIWRQRENQENSHSDGVSGKRAGKIDFHVTS